MRFISKILFVILLFVVSANTAGIHAQYTDRSETKTKTKKKKKKKSNVNKFGLFGFKGNGEIKREPTIITSV